MSALNERRRRTIGPNEGGATGSRSDPPAQIESIRRRILRHSMPSRGRSIHPGGWVVVAVVVLLLVSGLPFSSWAGTPSGAGTSGSPTRASVPAPSAPALPALATSAPLTEALNERSLCLLGVAPGCLPSRAPAPSAVSSTGTDPPSSWTNITPPGSDPSPPSRFLPAMSYYPQGHDDVLFGGYGEVGFGPFTFYQDTWTFASGRWSEAIANSSCTVASCPSARAGAMMAYDPALSGVVLFGGYVYSANISYIAFGDTWLFSNGAWENLSATAGTGPSPRFEGSMAYDPLDGYVLLFGGSTDTGASLGDTWAFNGTWTNLSASVGTAPSARAGASLANSPSGYLMLFGGESGPGVILSDATRPGACGPSVVAWWFYHGHWVMMPELPTCINTPPSTAPAPSVNGTYPPCGRVNAALGWSPGNRQFVLYGGLGPLNETSCQGFPNVYLNDTWTYANPPGAGFRWNPASDPGDPTFRYAMGYASDFTSGYFEIFGGYGGYGGGLNDTWRFFELVHATLTGPASVDTNATQGFLLPFTVNGFGGSGSLDYSFQYARLRNGNSLAGADCQNLTSGLSAPVPADGIATIPCQPTAGSYNIYRLTVTVVDNNNATDRASSNWTFTVLPPESAVLYSEYGKYFYTGFAFGNQFTALLKVNGAAATSTFATLNGAPVSFLSRAGTDYWDSPVLDMGVLPPNSVLRITGNFSGWTLNATYTIPMVSSPDWLLSLFHYTGAAQQVQTLGAGPFNKNYTIYENYSWNAAASSTFSIPTPMVGGNYGLVPAIEVSFSATSSGSIGLAGSASLASPTIDLGVVSLKITAAASVSAKFATSPTGPSVLSVQWTSAKATITVQGDLGASVPIYGFNILGVQVGFTLKLDLKPSVALTFLLAPTTEPSEEIVSGIEVMLTEILGTIQIALSVAVVFGIGIASVGMGGQIAVALAFHTAPSFGIGAGWVNGTVFVTVTALFWSDQWNILGPATIYNWTDPPAAGVRPTASGCPTCYDNGANSSWTVDSRYYVTSQYDANVWNLSVSAGPAITDIYPHTEVSAAPAADGAYLFYSDDNASLPVQQGLEVAGLHLNSSTNSLTALPAPRDPGYVLDHPEATTLPDGSVFVAWAALPDAETSLASPLALSSLPLHGARYVPGTGTWGPVMDFSQAGIVQSFVLDGTSGTLAALLAPSFLLGAATPERLVSYSLATGKPLTNASASGLSELLSVRGSLGDVVARDLGGNFSVLDLASGGPVSLALSLPSGAHLIGARFVDGAPGTLVLLVRNATASDVLLYDLTTGHTVATLPAGADLTDLAALANGATVYVLGATRTGVQGWSETGGVFSNLTTLAEPNLTSFGLVPDGATLLLYALVTNGNLSEPIVTLTFAEVGATLSPLSPPASSGNASGSSGSSSTTYLVYLGAVGAGVAVLLAVVAIAGRRKGPSASRTRRAEGGAAPGPTDSGPAEVGEPRAPEGTLHPPGGGAV